MLERTSTARWLALSATVLSVTACGDSGERAGIATVISVVDAGPWSGPDASATDSSDQDSSDQDMEQRSAAKADKPASDAADSDKMDDPRDESKPERTDDQPNVDQPEMRGTDAPSADEDGGMPDEAAAGPIERLDLLFVVDNSNSMAGEQEALKQAFPQFLQALTSGGASMPNAMSFKPQRDVHLGIVSTDMGIPGVELPPSCQADGGDDGRLLHAGHGADCNAVYPQFLTFNPDMSADDDAVARDFSCIAGLGTGGCGFEMPLESAFKALWPSKYYDERGNEIANPYRFISTSEQGTHGRGDVPATEGGNLGFLRNEPGSESLVAIIVVSDEDDCSIKDSEPLRPNNQLPEDSPYRMQDINLRCFLNADKLYDIKERYFRGLSQLRRHDKSRIVFAAITGVPTDLVDADARAELDVGDADAQTAYYDRILADPRMQHEEDPETNPGSGQGNLKPACKRTDSAGMPSTAYPGRRFVELAKHFGEQGLVQSICQDDFTDAMTAVVELIARQIEH